MFDALDIAWQDSLMVQSERVLRPGTHDFTSDHDVGNEWQALDRTGFRPSCH